MSDPQRRTAIAVMLDDLAPAVAAARAELDPAGALRIGLHITLLHPFMPCDGVTNALVARLCAFFGARTMPLFALARVEEFPGVVAYAAPEPAAELTELTRAVWTEFPDFPPYDGTISEPVPHATLVSYSRTGALLDQVRARVETAAPRLVRAVSGIVARGVRGRPVAGARAAAVRIGDVSFREDGAATVEWVASYLERVREFPVLAQVEPGDVRSRLPASPPETAEPFANVLRDLDEVLLPAITHWQSPRFFAYFANTGAEPGVLAELLSAGLNQVGILWRTSPALQELEELTLDWLAQLLGLPDGLHGHIEDTASTCTMAALAAARQAKPGARVVVTSEHAHSSVAKACRLLELEARLTAVDDEFRLRPDALDLTDACAVVATVGTTSTSSVDPVDVIADRAEAAGAWLHVDAAYAGSAAVCPELRGHFAGWERADSVVVNPHKWLLTPMDCSTLWTRRPDDLREAFSLVPEYLRVSEEVTSLSEYSPVLGRRFRALKLWAVLRCYGRAGLQERIREAIRLAALFEEWVRDEPGGS